MSRAWLCVPFALVLGCAHHTDERKDPPPAAPTATRSTESPAAPVAAATSSADSSSDLTCGPVKIHFPFNSSEFDPGERATLERSARCLKGDRALRVTIEGNADERGTDEYNLALGDRRAQVVANYLESLGVSGSQVKTVSFGKENPLCTSHDESCWSENRRAALKPSGVKHDR